MKPTIIFPWETWGYYVKEVFAQLKGEFDPFLRDEMCRLLEKIVEFTPPATTDQGAKAVKRDISRIVTPFSENALLEPRLAKIVADQNFGAFAAFANNVPSLQGLTLIRAEDVPALHQRMRNSRGGINRGVRLRNVVAGIDQIKLLREFIARKVSHVGMAIAGWTPALYFLGGVVTKPVSIVDAPTHGSYVADLENTERPSFDAVNATPWANQRDEGSRIIRNAQLSRIVALKLRLKYIVEGVMHKSGKHAA